MHDGNVADPRPVYSEPVPDESGRASMLPKLREIVHLTIFFRLFDTNKRALNRLIEVINNKRSRGTFLVKT